MLSVFALVIFTLCLSVSAVNLNSRDYPFHEVDLGPKLDAAPISREQANQALFTAMRLPEAMTELSALLHCAKGPDDLEAKVTHLVNNTKPAELNPRVMKAAFFELLADCIIEKAQHQHMRTEILRIISLGKDAGIVHNSSKLIEIQKAHLKLLQDEPPADLSEELKKAIAAAIAETGDKAGHGEPSEAWQKAIQAAKAAILAAEPAVALISDTVEDDITSMLSMMDQTTEKTMYSNVGDPDMAIAARLAMAAYTSSIGDFTAKAPVGVTNVAYIRGDSLGGDAYVGKVNDVIFLAFRGTSEAMDAYADLYALPSPWPYGGTSENVHTGFLNQYKEIRHRIISSLRSLGLGSGVKIIITGHSLGAALSWLAALDIQIDFSATVHLISFATPGPAWSGVLNTIENKVHTRYNFIYKADAVPCLPTHVGLLEPRPYRMLSKDGGSCSFFKGWQGGSNDIRKYRPTSQCYWDSSQNWDCRLCWSVADHMMGNYCAMVGLSQTTCK